MSANLLFASAGVSIAELSAPVLRGVRPGWSRLSEVGNKCWTHWRHVASGWELHHCGHPTANYPYHLSDPARPGFTVVTHNGKGFRTLELAQVVIEGIVAGIFVATDDRCVDGVLRVIDVGGENAIPSYLRLGERR